MEIMPSRVSWVIVRLQLLQISEPNHKVDLLLEAEVQSGFDFPGVIHWSDGDWERNENLKQKWSEPHCSNLRTCTQKPCLSS